MKKRKMINALVLSASYHYSLDNVNTSKYTLMAPDVGGDILGVTDIKKFSRHPIELFTIKATYMPTWLLKIKPLKTIWFIFHVIANALYTHLLNKKYDVIIAREPQFAGLVALILSKILRLPLVTEMNGNYASPLVWEDINSPLIRRIKRTMSLRIIPVVLQHSHAVKNLYPSQSEPFLANKRSRQPKVTTFHEYTPTKDLQPKEQQSKTILSMGYPSRIKGFDVLVRAFNKISHKIPDWQLHIVGYMPHDDYEELNKLRNGNERIKLLKPLEYSDAMKKISECGLFVLASRTEGMGRVLLEAMAHEKAVIGSDADGIPHYVKHDVNGRIFRSGDDSDLANKLLDLIESPEDILRYGQAGCELAKNEYSENSYKVHYLEMLKGVLA